MSDRDGYDGETTREVRLDEVRSIDPGDESERNFRYQHQYGVVLLAAVRRGSRDYVNIYCEHHEDLLCERTDELFDGWQIKTSTPENGAWTLKHKPLVHSIGRFIDLVTTYGSQIGLFFFVSNSEVDKVSDDVLDQKRRGRCPRLMLEHLRSLNDLANIGPPFLEAFNELSSTLAVDRQALFDVLRRTEIIKGPSRGEFDASLAQEHLGGLEECQSFTPPQLAKLRDELVARFHRAASLHVTDPERHVRGFFTKQNEDPVIAAKRIVCADVTFTSLIAAPKTFAYRGKPRLVLGGPRHASVLEQKLVAGGLGDAVEYMTAREVAAEFSLLEEQARNPMRAEHQLLQIEEAVHGECLEAYFATTQDERPFGSAMLTDVNTRLRKLEIERRELLGGQPYEILVGVAAMLTRECRVWWSRRFTVQEDRP